MADTNGKIALVTGANKGIGFEIARQLAQHGMFVYLGARNQERGEKAAATLSAQGLTVKPLMLDVTDAGSMAAAVSVVEKEHGHLDVLVNNAGIADGGDWSRKPSETPLVDVRKVFDTNFYGADWDDAGFSAAAAQIGSRAHRESVELARIANHP